MNFVLFLICGLVVNDAPPTGLLKGYMFLLVLDETSFLGCTSGSIRRNSGQVSSHAGVSKGGEPPLCRRGGGVHRGGTPSKGSRPYAPFCLLFRRGKSRPGSGGGAPIRSPERPALENYPNSGLGGGARRCSGRSKYFAWSRMGNTSGSCPASWAATASSAVVIQMGRPLRRLSSSM